MTVDHSEVLYQAILDTVGEALISIDRKQVIRMVNREVERIFGFTREELVGNSIHAIMPEEHRPRHDRAFASRIREGGAEYLSEFVEVEGLRKSGEVFPLELRFSTVSLGGELLVTAAARDITSRVRAMSELARKNEIIQELNRKLSNERDYLREEISAAAPLDRIVGESAAWRSVMAQVEAVAETNANVLITGESGVGKELIARAVHARSERSQRPLVKVNCAAIPKDLFESEFFGHVRGAFTGAVKDRVGRFQLADGGTIFLDEVGETPLDLQAKLLRVLEDHEFERIGDDQTRRVDVRVIAATNRVLDREVSERRFREDLFYRLSVFPIHVPPLRERLADILPLARQLLTLASADLGIAAPTWNPDLEPALLQYGWPGNIRELKNVMERMAILARGGPLDPEQLPLPGGVDRFAGLARSDERRVIDEALRRHGGVVKRAAEQLGLSRQALYRRMERLGIEVEGYKPGR